MIGFLNEKVPLSFDNKPVYVCFMAETSDGRILDFRRIHARRIQTEHEILIQASLSKPTAHIACHVMCDEVAGTSRSAEIKVDHIPIRVFPPNKTPRHDGRRAINTNESPMAGDFEKAGQVLEAADDFGDGGLDDDDLLAAETLEGIEVMDIDNLFEENNTNTKMKRSRTNLADANRKSTKEMHERTFDEPVRLENGKWACNHTCKKDGKDCKHKCCNEGVDRSRKPPQRKGNQDSEGGGAITAIAPRNQKRHKDPFEAAHSTTVERRHHQQNPGAQAARKLEKLHQTTGRSDSLTSISEERLGRNPPEEQSASKNSFVENPYGLSGLYKTEYLDDLEFEDLPMPKDLFGERRYLAHLEPSRDQGHKVRPNTLGEDLGLDENDSVPVEAGMVGLEDSVRLADAKNDSVFETGDLDMLEDSCSSSDTLDNFGSSKPQRSVDLGFFDAEEDLGFFETPLTHVEPQSLRKRSTYHKDMSVSVSSVALQPPEKGLFMTGESSSLYKARLLGDEPGPKRMLSAMDVFEDDQSLGTPPAKKTKSDVDTLHVNGLLSSPLQDATNTYSGSEAPKNVKRDSRLEQEQEVEKEEEGYEERQKRLWADVDPTLYEEFHDFVELVED